MALAVLADSFAGCVTAFDGDDGAEATFVTAFDCDEAISVVFVPDDGGETAFSACFAFPAFVVTAFFAADVASVAVTAFFDSFVDGDDGAEATFFTVFEAISVVFVPDDGGETAFFAADVGDEVFSCVGSAASASVAVAVFPDGGVTSFSAIFGSAAVAGSISFAFVGDEVFSCVGSASVVTAFVGDEAFSAIFAFLGGDDGGFFAAFDSSIGLNAWFAAI